MKQLFLSLLFLSGINLFSQSVIKFNYDAAGSMTQRYVQVLSLKLAYPTSIEKKDSILNFNIFPNPATDELTIEGPLSNNAKEAQLILYNINGAVVKRDMYYGTKKTIPLANLTTGIYFLQINYSKNQSSNYQIVITQ